MERCTYQDGGKWRIRIGDTEYSGQWVDRFAAYEDTGLEPEEIAKIREDVENGYMKSTARRYGISVDRLRELAEADRDERCVVLSEPMKPMVQKVNDTDVYCPTRGHTLSGGWPLSDADDYRKMCQCPNCGQSIDDTKCEVANAALKGEQDG